MFDDRMGLQMVSGFQSLSGFLMSCNPRGGDGSGCSGRFQSLSGFLMSCNPGDTPHHVGEYRMFQSLSGFLMSCNLARFEPLCDRRLTVSIPIGFSNEL